MGRRRGGARELGHRLAVGVVDARLRRGPEERAPEDLQVEAERPVVDVPDVEAEFLLPTPTKPERISQPPLQLVEVM